MSAGTSEFFCLICLLLCSCTAQTIKKAELGQDVILPCKISNINNITAVGWNRPELDPAYVLLYRDGLFDPDSQHPSYQNRVDLQDKEMKDGNASLTLKNVTTEDTGTYMCRVFQKGKKELISTIFLKVYLSAQEKITAELGKNAILPCKAPNKYNINDITAVEWNRPGLDPEHVLLYRDGRLHPEHQNPSYQNRVDLQDKEMKDGDVSLILKDVTKNDTGTYECHVSQKGKAELISIIDLEIRLPGNPWKIIVGVFVVIILLILAVVLVYKILQNRKWKKEKKEMQEQIQQVTQENETLQDDMETLRSDSIELQLMAEKNEFLDSYLKAWMETGRKLKTMIQNMKNKIQELDEMNFDTNSDPTGSDEKNQQEELKKLQDENQKLMKTVGNLKTELQNMNQELKLAGPLTVVDVNEKDRCIRLENSSSEEIQLKGWKLELQINDNGRDIFQFNELVRLQDGQILIMGWKSRSTDHSDVYQMWPELQNWNLGDKLQMNLISNKGEIFKLL